MCLLQQFHPIALLQVWNFSHIWRHYAYTTLYAFHQLTGDIDIWLILLVCAQSMKRAIPKVKGGQQSPVYWTGGVCNTSPNGPIDLKFCMWGSFGRYIWFLFKSRLYDLYRGKSHLEARTGLASVEVMWPWPE